MKKIITALDNEKINVELRKLADYEIIGNDISYQDGIFEILEKENPDILLLSEIIKGNLEIKNLILKIKEKNNNLEIIVFLEKENPELLNFLKMNEIYNVFYNNEITINELITKIEKKRDVVKLKKILDKTKAKVISIIGPSGAGKSTFAAEISKLISKEKKVLVMDFDLLNKDMSLILEKSNDVKLILGQDIMFNNENMELMNIKEIINNYKKEYDVIIINTSSECFFKFNKKLINLSDKCLFITGSNTIEIKKSKTLLDIYISEWKINSEKINIIINKYNIYSIDEKILKTIFKKYKLIGKIKFSKNNKCYINKNLIKKINI